MTVGLGVAMENNHGKILNSQFVLRCEPYDLLRVYGGRASTQTIQEGRRCNGEKYRRPLEDCGTYYTMSKDRLVSHQKHPEYINMLQRLYLMTESNTLKNTLDDWQYDYLFPCCSSALLSNHSNNFVTSFVTLL